MAAHRSLALAAATGPMHTRREEVVAKPIAAPPSQPQRSGVSVYATYQRKRGRNVVEDPLLELRKWAPGISDETLGRSAMILVVGDLAPQVTNIGMYLFENGIDIRLVQVRPYRIADRQLILTRSRLLPVPGRRRS